MSISHPGGAASALSGTAADCTGGGPTTARGAETTIARLREAVERDAGHSAAWKLLGKALSEAARPAEALAAYEQSVLVAVAELRDALAAYGREYERMQALVEAADAARNAVALADEQYKNGLVDFNTVLDAQRSLLAFEETVALSEGEIVTGLIRVYKALGGGWSVFAEREEPADAADAIPERLLKED